MSKQVTVVKYGDISISKMYCDCVVRNIASVGLKKIPEYFQQVLVMNVRIAFKFQDIII